MPSHTLSEKMKKARMSKHEDKMDIVMEEFLKGKVRSGGGDTVKDKKQAIAIALAEARKRGAKIPRKK
jgi:hypothetical protein